jgi:hypothetical protein
VEGGGEEGAAWEMGKDWFTSGGTPWAIFYLSVYLGSPIARCTSGCRKKEGISQRGRGVP